MQTLLKRLAGFMLMPTCCLFLVGGTLLPRSAQVFSLANLSVSVGREQLVVGPVSNYLDSPFFTMPISGGLRAFSSNATSYGFTGSNLDTVGFPTPAAPAADAILSPGPAGNFDECGAWLASAYELTATHWIAWYHAEHACDYAQGITHKSMAFAESFNAGKTWQKTNYPNNQVVTAPSQDTGDPVLDRAGDGKVIYSNGCFYLFYLGGDYQMYLARSTLANQGRPGTWEKWYDGAWSQPGIGGQQSPISIPFGGISFNSYLGSYLTIQVSARWGFYLQVSNGSDMTTWTPLDEKSADSIYPLATYSTDTRQDDWSRAPGSQLLYGYASIVGTNGDSSNSGQSFWLYYTKVFPGEDFTERYLFKRLITLSEGSSPPAVAATVELDRWQQSSGKIQVSTERATPDVSFVYQKRVAALLPYPAAGFHPLYECYSPSTSDTFVTNVDPPPDWSSCEGQTLIRNIGWAADAPTGAVTVPLYRCYNASVPTHFISTDPACEGATTEWLLGYGFP